MLRSPSVELLRALRQAIRPSTARQICPCARATRSLTTSSAVSNQPRPRTTINPYAPKHTDRGPKSTEDTQTDFGKMDVLGDVPVPATWVDACTSDGFHLDNGIKTAGGRGIILVGGEAFTWEPWKIHPQGSLGNLLDTRKGILTFPRESLGLLELMHPKPDLLIIGTGGRLWMLSPETRRYISETLGCRVDVMDTANASAAYNLLAKERGIEGGSGVGALFLPIGWIGVKQ